MNPSDSQSEQSSSELALQASRYLSGELNAIEIAEFEQRLADDQSARDALADLVQLTEAVQSLSLTEVQLAPVKSKQAALMRSRRRLVAWTLLSTAAVLSVVAVVNIPRFTSELPEGPLEIADAWTAMPETEIYLDPEEEPFEPLASLDVPDWMFAALDADDAAPGAGSSPAADEKENL